MLELAGLAVKTRLLYQLQFPINSKYFCCIKTKDKLLVGGIKMVGMCLY